MTTPVLALALVLPLQDTPHAGLHPADADLFFEAPDVSALLAAYGGTAMAGLMRDEEAAASLASLLGEDRIEAGDPIRWAVAKMTSDEELAAQFTDILKRIRTTSFSMSAPAAPGTNGVPGFEAIVDCADEEIASDVYDWLGGLMDESPVEIGSVRPLDADGGRYRRMADPMMPGLEVWTFQAGTRVVMGGGSFTPASWNRLRGAETESLASSPAYVAGTVGLGPGEGVPVLTGLHLRSPISIAASFDPDPGPEMEVMEQIGRFVFADRPQRWRMHLQGERVVTEVFTLPPPGSEGSDGPPAPWLGAEPVGHDMLDLVQPGALLALASTLDGEALSQTLLGALAEKEGRDVDAVHAELTEKLGEDPAALLGRMGPDFVLYADPIKGPTPNAYAVVELREPEGFLDGLTSLGEAAAEMFPGLRVKASNYKKVPYLSISLPPELISLGPAGTLRPAVTVLDGRLFVTTTSLKLKAEIRERLEADEAAASGEAPTQAPAQAPMAVPRAATWQGVAAALPADATTIALIDWGAQLEALFSLARTFGPMLGEMAGDLPFDFMNLPEATVFTRHMKPTLHTVQLREGGARYTRHEASFGWETWIGLVGVGVKVAEKLESAFAPPPPAGFGGPIELSEIEIIEIDPREETLEAILDLRTALTVYKIERAAYPAELVTLTKSTTGYPNGFLESGAVPSDGWMRAFRYELAQDGSYRLWSTGPDGVDQNGEGDDLTGP